MRYRREIDGLRAIAVLPVILFHAGFEVFSGGYVGVDVFLVISGYLITSLLIGELEQGKFSIARFYERRARRILPALFFVMLACLPFAYLWMQPTQLRDFAQSLAAVIFFSSNFLFWIESGYFAPSAELKPLLHTWSLAVEEQYYIIFPVFLLLFWRFGRSRVFLSVCLIALLSVLLAEWGWRNSPNANFYLAPFRAWELLAGSICAFLTFGKTRLSSNALSATGLFLIIFSVFAYDAATPFPSFYALVPVGGTALIILFASQTTWVTRVLSTAPFVGIGLVSYSAYLWHQPLFAFARLRNLNEPSNTIMAGLVVASIVLAWATWYWVEQPFRKREKPRLTTQRRVFLTSGAVSAVFVAIGLTGHIGKGFDWRFSKEQAAFLNSFENNIPEMRYFTRVGILEEYRSQCDFMDLPKYRSGSQSRAPVVSLSQDCYLRNESSAHSIFLWGDSHAQMLYPGLSRAMPEDWQILQVTSSGCAAKLNATPSKINYCEQSNWFAFRTIAEVVPDVVLIGQSAGHNIADMEFFGKTLLAIGVNKVIFTGPSPHWSTDLPYVVVRLWKDVPRTTLTGVNLEVLNHDQTLQAEFNATDSLHYVSIIDNFCDDDGCLIYIGDSVRDGITSWDSGHLTPIASADFATNVLVEEILQ